MGASHNVILVVFFSVFVACNNDRRVANKLYDRRNYLLQEFRDKSIIGRGEVFYQLSYYSRQSVNTFYFVKKGEDLVFTNDTLQYPVKNIPAFATINEADSLVYRSIVSKELKRLLKVMDDLKISHVSAEERYAGIDMKLYFGDYKALLYIKNVSNIQNERWKSYVLAGQKLDDYWYYVKEE
jgi:hypothetical protein